MSASPSVLAARSGEATPAIIASHLDIVYSVYASKPRRDPTDEQDDGGLGLSRILSRPPVRRKHLVHAVKDASFIVNKGESVGILGRNGSGKSTILRALAGLLPPTGGQVWINGEASLLGVNAVLLSNLSGLRNIELAGLSLGMSHAEIRRLIPEVVEFAELEDSIHLPMKTYSSGMAARLRFALATVKAPDILMVDEALGTGDARFQERSRERIGQIRAQAGTLFMVSHSAATISEHCQRALWMHQGRLVMDGPTPEVAEAYRASMMGTTKKPTATEQLRAVRKDLLEARQDLEDAQRRATRREHDLQQAEERLAQLEYELGELRGEDLDVDTDPDGSTPVGAPTRAGSDQ